MSKIKLTIGMPMYHDYHGAWFSLQSLRLTEDLSNVELLLIDNDPSYEGSPMIKGALDHIFHHGCGASTYIPYSDVIGPANAKNKVFEYAQGEYVLCIDSHVLFRPGTIKKLLDYYDRNPDTQNLIQGPLLYDDLFHTSTHFDDNWRGEMWGTWGSAWTTREGINFSALDNKGILKCAELNLGLKEIAGDDLLPIFPTMPYTGHEEALIKMGCRKLGDLDSDEFEIPGNGCGLMSCRKDAWLGFNPNFSGFGGEEMYIHEKYRQAGHKTISLGFLKWLHRFGRPEGVKFPLTRLAKVKNYIIGHEELGLSLDRIYEHFVLEGLMGIDEWNIAAGIVNKPKDNYLTMDTLFNRLYNIPRDIEQHMPLLKELANNCKSVTEFSHRVETLIAFASADSQPKIVSYNLEGQRIEAQAAVELRPDIELIIKPSHEINHIEDTDMLFLDSEHTYHYLTNELNKFAKNTKQYIVLHDTVSFGSKGSDEGKGLAYAVHDFIRTNPNWFISAHTDDQHGLTILSCQELDRPAQRISLIPPSFGPGTEMKSILASLGVNPAPGCDCNRKAMQMNIWGIDGCKREKDTIIKWIEESQERWGWKSRLDFAAKNEEELEPPKSMSEKFSILWKAVTSGLIFKLNPLRPVESLVDESIRRAEIKENAGEYEGLI